MENIRLAHLASLICLAGAIVQIIYGLLAVPFPYAKYTYGWDEILWALANVGMMGGAIGLLSLDVARPRWIAVIGAVLTVLGNLIRIVVSALLIVTPSPNYVPLILISILLVVVGMVALGLTALLGKHLTGWPAWTPLIAGGFTLVPAAVYSIDPYIHYILLGLWGIAWLLVGYTVFTHSPEQERNMLIESSGPGTGFRPGIARPR